MDKEQFFQPGEVLLSWFDIAKEVGKIALDFVTDERVIKTAVMVSGLVGMLLED